MSSDDETAMVFESQRVEQQLQEEERMMYMVDTSDISDAENDEAGDETGSDQTRRQTGRFAAPMTEEQMAKASTPNVPEKTAKCIKWATKMYEAWRQNRNARILDGTQVPLGTLSIIPYTLDKLNDDELNYTLSRFVMETRKIDGTEYPPRTMRSIVILIQMFLHQRNRPVKLLSDPNFKELQNTLDNVMKTRAAQGMGLHVRRAQVITKSQENVLWQKGLLGESSPQVLLDTMLYLLGLNFALRSGEEHRSLARNQLTVASDDEGEYLLYTENITKTNKRGLKHYRVERQLRKVYTNKDCPERCVVRLFKLYIERCPADETGDGPLYRKPLKNIKQSQWYGAAAVGRNSLASTVGRLCKQAGLQGKTMISFEIYML